MIGAPCVACDVRRDAREGSEHVQFPYGEFDADLITFCQHGFFITHLPVLLPKRDEFVVGRTKADPEDWPLEFCLKLCGAYRWRNRWHLTGRPAPFRSEVPVNGSVN